MKERTLENKVAIITGGGTGIGRGIAEAMAARGATVILAGRRREPLERVVAGIVEAGGTASACTTDVRDEDACADVVQCAVDRYGGLDCLVSNAGMYPRRALADLTQEIWDQTIDVNLRGHFFMAKHAIPVLVDRGGGSILFTGSVHGQKGDADVLAYAAAKGGLWIMTLNLARTYAQYGIRVNYLNPGWVASEYEVAHRRELGCDESWLEEQGAAVVPMGRLQTPEDSGHLVAFIASDAASQITATRFNVDGGLSVVM